VLAVVLLPGIRLLLAIERVLTRAQKCGNGQIRMLLALVVLQEQLLVLAIVLLLLLLLLLRLLPILLF
jgi:hypothetical protein